MPKENKARGLPFGRGQTPPKSPGRPRLTPERRAARAAAELAVKELAFDLKAKYAEHLPKILKRVIEGTERKDKSIARDRFRKDVLVEMADRLYGRPPQAITGKGGGPLLVTFGQVLAGVNGAKQEKLA